jgi:phosphinothricin acetyltransferase
MADYAIRAATLDDLEALTDIYNHSIVNSAITFDLQTFAPSERRGWFDDHSHAGPHRLLVGTDNRGRCLGLRYQAPTAILSPRSNDWHRSCR